MSLMLNTQYLSVWCVYANKNLSTTPKCSVCACPCAAVGRNSQCPLGAARRTHDPERRTTKSTIFATAMLPTTPSLIFNGYFIFFRVQVIFFLLTFIKYKLHYNLLFLVNSRGFTTGIFNIFLWKYSTNYCWYNNSNYFIEKENTMTLLGIRLQYTRVVKNNSKEISYIASLPSSAYMSTAGHRPAYVIYMSYPNS